MVNLKDLRKERVRKRIGDVEIYNIQTQDNEKILKILDQYKDVPDMELATVFIFRDLIPILTNICFDDLEEHEIVDVILNPNDLLVDVIKELDAILLEFTDSLRKVVKQYQDNEEQIAKLEKELSKFKK